MRKTKIICTIGPATDSMEMLKQLADAGMNIARLNMSHGDHQSHAAVIKSIRQLNTSAPHPVAVLLDTQGPEIRTGVRNEALDLKEGDVISVTARGDEVEESSIRINYQDLITDVAVGDKITVDNGLINLEVLSKEDRIMQCRVIDGGVLKSKRHVNLPGIRVNLPAITEKDKRDIQFAMDQDVDFIALSFVRERSDIEQLEALLGDKRDRIKIIAKIEDQEGLKNIADIIDAADGVMVARGDLGVEVDIEELPRIQRRIIRLCAEAGKRAIVATHMLESMIDNPIPTRAEVTDVSNAVYEEADAIMLSGETTIGKYPVKCVEMLNRIARSTEQSSSYMCFTDNLRLDTDKQQIADAAVKLAATINAKAIIVPTETGRTANSITNCHPRSAVICAFTESEKVRQQLVINRNLLSYQIQFSHDPEDTLKGAIRILLDNNKLDSDDKVVVISDTLSGKGIDAIQIRSVASIVTD